MLKELEQRLVDYRREEHDFDFGYFKLNNGKKDIVWVYSEHFALNMAIGVDYKGNPVLDERLSVVTTDNMADENNLVENKAKLLKEEVDKIMRIEKELLDAYGRKEVK